MQEGRFNGSILASGLLTPDYWVESLELEGQQAEAKWRGLVETTGDWGEATYPRGVEKSIWDPWLLGEAPVCQRLPGLTPHGVGG